MSRSTQGSADRFKLCRMTASELVREANAFRSEGEHFLLHAQLAAAAGLHPFRDDPEGFIRFVRRARALRDEMVQRVFRGGEHECGATEAGATLLAEQREESDDSVDLSGSTITELLGDWTFLSQQLTAAFQATSTPEATPCEILDEYASCSRRSAAVEEELGRRWLEERRQRVH